MSNNFSQSVKETISLSFEEALRLGNSFIDTEHLLLGLIKGGDNAAVRILKSFQVDLSELRKEIELTLKGKSNSPSQSASSVGTKVLFKSSTFPLTLQAEKVLRESALQAQDLKSRTVETDHLMLSILNSKENTAMQILRQVKRGLS